MSADQPIDLDDTTNCPVGHRCESCGVEGDDLEVTTAHTVVGVLCLTLCPRCSAAATAPPVSVSTAVKLALMHCGHLSIDVGQMAAELDRRTDR